MKIDPSGKVDRTLQKGDAGIAVALWQQFLIRQRKMDWLSEDDVVGSTSGDDHIIGEFEARTVEATKKYQQEKGLRVDGILGSKTYAEAAKEGFNGNEVEAALLLGFNRVNRSLVGKVEVSFSPNSIAFKIDGNQLGLYEALKRLKILDGL